MKSLAILLGASGHARVVAGAAREAGIEMLGVCDPYLAAKGQSKWEDLKVLGPDDALSQYDPNQYVLLNGIGILTGCTKRKDLHKKMLLAGWQFSTILHPNAWVAPDVILMHGVQVMAGAVIQPGTIVGEGTIINTRASIDHDCKIGAFSHIAPGAVLCGSITMEDDVFIGAGAIVLPNLQLSAGAVAAAGSTITTNISQKKLSFGRFSSSVQSVS